MARLSANTVFATKRVINGNCMSAFQINSRKFSSPSTPRKEKDAVIMRQRQKEAEIRKYGAPKGQAFLIAIGGIVSLGVCAWGWMNMDPRQGSIASRSRY